MITRVGNRPCPFNTLRKKSYSRPAIASRLDKDVEEVAVLVDGPPEISALSLNRGEDFV